MFEGTFGPVSNRASWAETHKLLNEDGSVPPVTEIVFSFGDGCSCLVTKKLSEEEITWDDATGEFSWLIDDDELRRFYPGVYPAGLVATVNGEPIQIVGGSSVVNIVAGNVP